MKKIDIRLILVEWNRWNGLIISLLEIQEKALFSVYTDFNRFCIFDIFFVEFTLFDKTP